MARAGGRIWLGAPTRFAGLPAGRAWAAFGLLILLLAVSLTALHHNGPPGVSHKPARRADEQADIVLYEKIVDGVGNGGNYYRVAAEALRAHHYPMRPFVTFREPTLALVQAQLPQPIIHVLLDLLAAATLILWTLRLRTALIRVAPLVIAAALMAAGLMAFVQADLWSFHEVWAGLFVAFSLGLWRREHWRASVVLGLAAMLVRETAALYGLVMLISAAREGRRREAFAWSTALALFAAALAAHAWAVSTVTSVTDLASPGWSGLQGAGFFVTAIIISTALQVLPVWFGALLIAFSLFGWIGWRDPLAARASAILFAYGLLLAVFARPDTFYWALIVAPLSLIGLVFVPDAIHDLSAAALDKRRASVRG